MTFGFQTSALAAATKPGFSSEQAAAEQVRNATLTPFCGACASGVLMGMSAGSAEAASTIAFALARPVGASFTAVAVFVIDTAPLDESEPLPLDLHAASDRAQAATTAAAAIARCFIGNSL